MARRPPSVQAVASQAGGLAHLNGLPESQGSGRRGRRAGLGGRRGRRRPGGRWTRLGGRGRPGGRRGLLARRWRRLPGANADRGWGPLPLLGCRMGGTMGRQTPAACGGGGGGGPFAAAPKGRCRAWGPSHRGAGRSAELWAGPTCRASSVALHGRFAGVDVRVDLPAARVGLSACNAPLVQRGWRARAGKAGGRTGAGRAARPAHQVGPNARGAQVGVGVGVGHRGVAVGEPEESACATQAAVLANHPRPPVQPGRCQPHRTQPTQPRAHPCWARS